MENEYLKVKNFIHNELKLNQDFIEKILQEYVEKSIDKVIKDKIESNWMTNLILAKVAEVISEEDYNKPVLYRENKMKTYIKSVIKDAVHKQIIEKINFNINVDLNK
jgi:hypothetical protein